MKEFVVWGDAVMRLALGTVLVLVPRATSSVFGLPQTADSFWSRTLGVVLLALGAGSLLDIRYPGKGGPTIGGLVTLNLVMGFALATALVVGQLEIPRRGRLLLWLAAILSALLGLVQLAWV